MGRHHGSRSTPSHKDERPVGSDELSCEIRHFVAAAALTNYRRNFVPADAFPYRTASGALLDSGNYQEAIRRGVSEGKLAELKSRRDAARAEGRLYGIGFTADLAISTQTNRQSVTIDPTGATDISQVAITLTRI